MKQEREFLAHRAHVQAIVASDNHKVVQSAFDDLANAFNPYLEGHKKDEERRAKERMLKEISRGALTIMPTGPAIGSMNKMALRKKLVEEFKTTKESRKEPPPRLDNQFVRRRSR